MPFFRSTIIPTLSTDDKYGYTYFINDVPQDTWYNSLTVSNSLNFNSNVIIGNHVGGCNNLFNNLRNFNYPIELPDSMQYAVNMFRNCRNYAQPITHFPNSMIDCSNMFHTTNVPRLNVVIPKSVVNVQKAFFSRVSRNLFAGNIFVNYNPSCNYDNMVVLMNLPSYAAYARKVVLNVYSSHVDFNWVKYTTSTSLDSDGDTVALTYVALASGKGYFNQHYNVYLYNYDYYGE